MGLVERTQRLLGRVHARTAVGADQLGGGPCLPAGLEIHRQECEVECHVPAAQRRIELDPVDDTHLRTGEDVLAAQVAMTVTGEAATCAVVQLPRVCGHEGLTELPHDIQLPALWRILLSQLFDVLPPQLAHTLDIPSRGGLCGAMEPGKQAGGGDDVCTLE